MAEYESEKPQAEPAADKPSFPDMRKWKHRIKTARKLREDWEREYDVKRCEEFFLGKQWAQGGKRGPRVMNHFLATQKVTQTNLLFDNPRPLVRPKPGREMVTARKASIAEQVLRVIMEQDDNFAEASGFGLLQAFFRIGIIKVIYDPTLEPNPNAQREMVETDGDGNPILDAMGQPTPVIDPETGLPVIEPDMVVTDDTYRFEWVDARHMLLPDRGPYMRKWDWIGEEITVPLEDAKSDERFPIELRAQFKANVKRTDKDGHGQSQDADNSENDEWGQFFRYCECYDIRKKRWVVIAEDQAFDEPLIDDAFPEGIEDHPYAILPGWTPIIAPEPSPWPLPHTQPWLDVQEEYNIRREQQMQGAKRSARKVGYDSGTFDDADEALKMLQSSRDMEGVKLQDTAKPPIFITDPPINPDIWNDSSALMNDYRIISGQTGAKMSGSSDSNTATEAQFVERASTLRDAEMQKVVYRWLKTALRKMLQRVRATMTNRMMIKLRGMTDEELAQYLASIYGIMPEQLDMFPGLSQYLVQTFGREKVEMVGREDLTFEADIDIVPGSTRPRSLPQEKQQFLEFLQIFAQFPQLALSRALLDELAKKYEFLNPQIVEELQILAQTLMQVNANQAGRSGTGDQNRGGQNTAPENTPGSESQSMRSQAQSGVG